MKKKLIAALPAMLVILSANGLAGQTSPQGSQEQRAARPAPRLSLMDNIKRSLQRLGSAVDAAKSTANMVVSNYPDPKGGKTTIVILNNPSKSLLGFYIYNFGSLKEVSNREEVYKYLLSTNDAITIGSFFVDGEGDIGYKYMVSTQQPFNQAAFESAYLTMAAVARERRAEIRKLLGASETKEEKSADL
ncbi:MAG TPA: hypothetical protein VNO70_25020 [Blastocatellia bacterium]|nr:hypothetical protein [Blastocatellia bacterium]